MFVLTAVVAYAALLTQFPSHVSIVVILLTVFVPTYFTLERSNWRKINYGGFLGILVIGAVGVAIASVRFMPPPNTNRGPRYERTHLVEFARQFSSLAVPIGFAAGSILCMVCFRLISHRKMIASRRESAKCPSYGNATEIGVTNCKTPVVQSDLADAA